MSAMLAGTPDARLLEGADRILRDMVDRLRDRLSVDFGKDHAGRTCIDFQEKTHFIASPHDDTMEISFDARLWFEDEIDTSPIFDKPPESVVKVTRKRSLKTREFKFAFAIEKRHLAILDDFSLAEKLRSNLRDVEEKIFDAASNMLVAEAAKIVAEPRKHPDIIVMDEAGSIMAPAEEKMPEGFGSW